MKVLVVGDTIIDEYHYVLPMAKSPKENVIATRYLSEERFAGETPCLPANHLASLCNGVDLITCLGGPESHEEFIRAHLKPDNVAPTFFYRADAPTVVKRRFVEEVLQAKTLRGLLSQARSDLDGPRGRDSRLSRVDPLPLRPRARDGLRPWDDRTQDDPDALHPVAVLGGQYPIQQRTGTI